MDRFASKYTSMTPYQYGALNPIRYIDVNGDSIWVGIGNDQFNNYTPGMEYTGNNGFTSSIISTLNELNSTESGAAVLSVLVGSENNFDLLNIAPDTEGAGAAFTPNKDGGGILKVGNANSLSDISHEIFHGYQGETGLTPLRTTAAEVGAYLFQDVVAFERGGRFGLPSSNNEYGVRYDEAHNNLLFDGYNQTDYIRANLYFKYSSRNSYGL